MQTKIQKFLKLPFSRKTQFIAHVYHKVKTYTFYRLLFKSMGKGSVIKNPLFMTPEFITIGNNVIIWDDARIEAVSSYAGTSFTPRIIIEDGVSFQQRCHITAVTTLIIGKNTVASFDVMITDIDHEYQNLGISVIKQPLIVKQTQIGENCFIGSGAKIQAGTILGKHCVIGANAVVRGVFPDYSVIVGVPAKIVKRYNVQTEKWEKTNEKGEFYIEI